MSIQLLLDEARANVGDPMRVKGPVARAYYARNSRGRPTFIDIGAAYPKRNRLTLLIWAEDRANFPTPPEKMFHRGQLVCAQGIVSTYKGAPQIEVGIWDPANRMLTF